MLLLKRNKQWSGEEGPLCFVADVELIHPFTPFTVTKKYLSQGQRRNHEIDEQTRRLKRQKGERRKKKRRKEKKEKGSSGRKEVYKRHVSFLSEAGGFKEKGLSLIGWSLNWWVGKRSGQRKTEEIGKWATGNSYECSETEILEKILERGGQEELSHDSWGHQRASSAITSGMV